MSRGILDMERSRNVCWTSLMQEKAEILWMAGRSYAQIATALNVSKGSAAGNIRRMGLTADSRPTKYNEWKRVGDTAVVKKYRGLVR